MYPKKKVCKDFEKENLREYHNLHVQDDTLLLADAFNNFQSIYFEKYELDSAHFLFAPGLAWQAALKTTKVIRDLLTDTDISLMIEKYIILEAEYVMLFIDMRNLMTNT